MTGATPETDALCSDPAIERRDVPARVWREMARIEFERDALRSRNAELVEDAARYRAKKHIDCLKFMETKGYKACKDTDSLLIAWNLSYDAAIDAFLKAPA
jgi:hypothetical protein